MYAVDCFVASTCWFKCAQSGLLLSWSSCMVATECAVVILCLIAIGAALL
jgi:hypothetical protein